ncbi:MFS transporter [Kitasatospora xanthocidica]|uniref:MFS transporter n=1 Tax=Kitasatospora xanthocidica TaxID=83382 RepID=UPI0019B57CC4|nr:MFS transporter [Kitasatospora xanthocidica]GHF39249.1 MFS transporter [Kitasatospora xanthocidica]
MIDTAAPCRPSPAAPTRGVPIVLLAAASAVTAANVYLSQPLLGAAARSLHSSPALLGAVPTATQFGYAVGIALLVPAGDCVDRRRLICALSGAAALALAACALAPGPGWLAAAGFVLGLVSPVPQLVAPLAVALAGGRATGQAAGRPVGRTVGVVQAGLLVGVLGARTYAGAVASVAGWRAVFWCSAGLTLLLTLVLRRTLPALPPVGAVRYGAALASLPRLFTAEPLVRRVTVSGALVGVSFGAFWTALTLLLDQHYRFGSTVIGLFGLVAAASALLSPAAGRLADRLGARRGPAALVVAVLAGWALLLPGGGSLGWLTAGVVVLDVATWGNQVACQSALFTLSPGAHNRLNTCYFTLRFAGIAVGSTVGSLAWAQGGWSAVVAAGVAAGLAALAVTVARSRPRRG